MPDAIPRGPFDQGLFLTHFNKGREAFDERRYDEAERQLEEAYLLRPRDTRVLNLLGLVYFRADKLIKAEEVYRKLVAQNPDAATLYYNLGLICFKLTRLEDAEQAFRKAAELSGGNPKIHFYLGSIYERLQRYKDAIYNYRQAGANLMVQRLQGKLDRGLTPGAGIAAAGVTPSGGVPRGGPSSEQTQPPLPPPAEEEPAFFGEKVLQAISPGLLAPSPSPAGVSVQTARVVEGDATLPGRPSPPSAPGLAAAPVGHVFRSLEPSLVEVDFSGRVFIKQGTIYSYSGNLTFWVKDERPGGHPPLAIVTGTGRLLLTDQDREITFLTVSPEEPVFVEPGHLLACEDGLEPRFENVAGQSVILLDGKGSVALSVATKALRLAVRPNQPVSIPAASLIAWTGTLSATVVDDPQVYAVVAQAAGSGRRLLRLEGNGRVLVEHASN